MGGGITGFSGSPSGDDTFFSSWEYLVRQTHGPHEAGFLCTVGGVHHFKLHQSCVKDGVHREKQLDSVTFQFKDALKEIKT